MEQFRQKLYDKVVEMLRAVKNGDENITELHFMLLGFSKAGKQSLGKSTQTWEYVFKNAPGGLEYIARYWVQFMPEKHTSANPMSIGLERTEMDLNNTLTFSTGDTEHIEEFVEDLPQWIELGIKPHWGKWRKNEELSNTWNVAVLAVLYELIYDKPVHILQLIEAVKTREFEPTCQFNLCNGVPGAKHKILTPAMREEQIQDLVAGKPAKLRASKEFQQEKPKTGLKISFGD